MRVSWASYLYGRGDGYGNSAMEMLRGLTDRGIDVRVEPGYLQAGEVDLIADVLAKPVHIDSDLRIIYAPPLWPHPWGAKSEKQATLAVTMWEDDACPPFWPEHFARVDAVGAPSRFCQQMFQKNCSSEVLYVPLGVNADAFPYRRRSNPHATGEPFVVLHTTTGMGDPRKGAREAIAAFKAAFTNGENVQLILRAQHGIISEAIGDPRIVPWSAYLPEDQKKNVLYAAHVLLYPSWGEGFGLLPLEAIATGLPAICSLNTSMLDYAYLFDGVACDPVPSVLQTPTIPRSHGQLQKPRHNELVNQLKFAYMSYEQATNIADDRARKVRMWWTYAHTIDALQGAMATAIERKRGQ